MMPSVKGLPLTLYLTSINKVGTLLAQELDKVEHPVYCLSRFLRGFELNYLFIEYHCLALIFATQKLCHYLLTHPLNLAIKSNPLKYIILRPTISGCTARWLLQLNEFGITIATPRGLQSQALLDLLAQFLAGGYELLHEELPGEEVCPTDTN